ncbi:hypothetical protein [Phaeovulum sp.]|uniref:hypothetical protein n=1 Tax=Phaeovulum sp. TaxID=2934796 RepID=UPI0039E68D6D
MRGHDNIHSRLVAWAKIALPLAALVLLSTLFMFSGKVDPSDAIPYADVDVADLAREPRLTAPEYAGVTEDGGALTVTAETATPDPDGQGGAVAHAMVAHLETPSGLKAELASASGRIDPAAGLISFSKAVVLSTSTGYSVKTADLQAATDRSLLTAPGPVDATTPFGTLTAGSMRLSSADGGATHVLVFNDGVKLIYRPEE